MQERNAAIKIPDSRTDKAFFYSQWPPNVKCGSCPQSRRREFSFPGACICLGCSVTFPFPPSDPGLLGHLWKSIWGLVRVGERTSKPQLGQVYSWDVHQEKRRWSWAQVSQQQLTSPSEVSSGGLNSLLISVWNKSDLFCTKRCDRMGLHRPRC